ncbi:MAG: hypothetical protein M0Z37_05570 [Nitrospiraceae bacterium]|jgi:hypothetical protein|nr:hypothetical protein [Nitrospiraceae bacterium]
MSILLGHSSIRPLTNILQKVNLICEKEMIGFALLSRKGFLRAADSFFLSFLDRKIISVGTLPQAEIEKTFLSKTLPEHAATINLWIRGNAAPASGLWHATVPFGQTSLELFRASVTNSDEEAALFFRVTGEQAFQKNTLPRIYTELSDEITEILLDSMDHEKILEVLSDPFWENPELPDLPKVFLWNTARWQKNSFLIQLSPRTSIENHVPITTAITSIIPKKVIQSVSVPVTRSFFIREPDQENIHMIIPLLRGTSHLGWVIQKLTTEGQNKTDITHHIQQKTNDLTRKIFRNREEVRLISPLNLDPDSALLSRRGLIDGLTDLLEMASLKKQGVGVIGITLSESRGIFPLVEHLEIFTRSSDLLGRISPLEFLALLPDTSRSGTEKALIRMKSALLAEVAKNASLLARFTFCHAPEDGVSPLKLLRAAFQEGPHTNFDSRGQNPFG